MGGRERVSASAGERERGEGPRGVRGGREGGKDGGREGGGGKEEGKEERRKGGREENESG